MQSIQLQNGEDVWINPKAGEFAVVRGSWDVHPHLFTVTADHPFRGFDHYSRFKRLPRSCIESAEFAIQLFYDPSLRWSVAGEQRTPHVYAHFISATGGASTLNVTTSRTLQNDITGMQSFAFRASPQLGEGLIIANSTNNEHRYHMHLGAVVARHRTADACILTDVSEDGDVIAIHTWPIVLVEGVAEFRGMDYQSADFVMGLLTI